jgi:hypothetical protein
MAEYILFYDEEKDLVEDEPLERELKDKETFDQFSAKIIISRSAEKLPDGDLLWLQKKTSFRPDDRPDHPWRVKILEKYAGEETPEVERKTQRVSLGERGDMLRSLIREREKKK